MPVVLIGGFRFFFDSNEGDPREPAHVYVRRGGAVAKFWLHPKVRLAESYGFDARTCDQLAKLVEASMAAIERAWDERFR